MKGILLMHTGRYVEGLQMAESAIEIYGEFGLYNLAQTLSRELEDYIKVLRDDNGLQ